MRRKRSHPGRLQRRVDMTQSALPIAAQETSGFNSTKRNATCARVAATHAVQRQEPHFRRRSSKGMRGSALFEMLAGELAVRAKTRGARWSMRLMRLPTQMTGTGRNRTLPYVGDASY